jgi:hypothetical protein
MQKMRTTIALVIFVATVTSSAAYEWRALAIPAGRSLATFVADPPTHRALLFGGVSGGVAMNDAWLLSMDTVNGYGWQELRLTGSPPARWGHAAIFDPSHNRVLVFGGIGSSGVRNDVWQLDVATRTWTDVTPSGPGPQARAYFPGVYDSARNSMIIFGGFDPPQWIFMNDVWELDLDSLEWRQVHPSGTAPSGRSSCNCALSVQRNMLIVCGGQSGNEMLDEEWGLDLTPGAEAWSRLTTTGDRLGVRNSAATTIDPAGDRMICFGGFDYPGYYRFFADLHVLDVATLQWSELHPSGDVPSARRCATPLWDAGNGNFVFFGGETEAGCVGDLHYIGLAELALWEAGTQPSRTSSDIELPTVTRAPLLARCCLPPGRHVNVRILDATGRLLARPSLSADGTFVWDGRDTDGKDAPAGSYFCSLQTSAESVSRSFRLVR